MIYIAIDHRDTATGRPMPNGIPQEQHHLIEQMDRDRLDYPRILDYMHQCHVPHKIVETEHSPNGAWYLVVIGYFDFATDYLSIVSRVAYDRIKRKEMLLVFTYHEGDNPRLIRNRFEELCDQHNIDSSLVWLISGNSAADRVPNCVYWPETEFMYWRTADLHTGAPYHMYPRSKKFTALCRIDKLWRKVFMSELWANNYHQDGYFSYTQHLLGNDDSYRSCILSNHYLAHKQHQVNQFISAGPFFVDTLDTNTHNNYAVNMGNLYRDSYFNIVLETMIDVDRSDGILFSEKTCKPLLNNQFFVVVGAANHMSHLRELGYKSFGRVIDESYDSIKDHQERFKAVLALTKSLCAKSLTELHAIYQQLEPEITHNHQVFVAGMCHRFQTVVNSINYKP